MTQFLLMDIGNSTVELAVYDQGLDVLVQTHKQPTHLLRDAPHFLNQYVHVDGVIVSSVVPHMDGFVRSVFPQAVFVDAFNIPLLTIDVDSLEVGADRLVNALGAYDGRKKSCLIIDSGTATTFCWVTQEGVYKGGAIFPGMGIASKALNDYTAKIPLIYVQPDPPFVGRTTQGAVHSGLFYGFVDMINGMIVRYRRLDPAIAVVGTGQGLDILAPYVDIDAYDTQLIFKGLMAVCRRLF